MKKLLILIAFCGLSSAFDSFENELRSQCSSDFTGDEGICVEAKDCPAFKTSRNELKICSFNRRVPIVCCPRQMIDNREGQNRISAQKCIEYAAQQSKSSVASVLRILRNSSNNNEAFFVGGTKTFKNEFPHMSAIGWRQSDEEISWRCGGSLISDRFVLSAAHCTNSHGGKPSVIRIGDKDLQDPLDGVNPQEFLIKNIFVHPNYTKSLKYHDIALFELDRSANFDSSVFPACLSQNFDEFAHYPPTAMGWGQTSFGGKSSSTLMKGSLKIVNNNECNQSYTDEEQLPEGITNAQICAWDPEGERDTCLGDSGGPLQITRTSTATQQNYFEIIGITSFGKFCAAGVPGVYVKVSSYLDWIESIVWPNNL